MGKHVHRLSEVDPGNRSAVCAHCGPVKISSAGLYKGRQRWRCIVIKRETDNNDARKTYQQKYAEEYYRRTGGASQHKAWIKQYGITPEDYQQMMDEQEGKCVLCREECSSGQRLSVDHNHDTGKVRGLLCRNCNRGLGLLKEDPSVLLRAIEYLGKYADS